MNLNKAKIGDKFTVEMVITHIDKLGIIFDQTEGNTYGTNTFNPSTLIKSIKSGPVDIFVGLKFKNKNGKQTNFNVLDIDGSMVIYKYTDQFGCLQVSKASIKSLQNWLDPDNGCYEIVEPQERKD